MQPFCGSCGVKLRYPTPEEPVAQLSVGALQTGGQALIVGFEAREIG